MPLNPKLKKFVQKDLSYIYSCNPQQASELMGKDLKKFSSKPEEIGSVINRTVKTAERETPIRLFYPKNSKNCPALIYLHGGGLIIGNMDDQDPVCRKIAKNVCCLVISVDYGLAPEFKIPKSAEECYQIAKWVYENAKDLGIDQNRIAIMGESAGGTLAAVVSQFSRDRNEFSLIYQVLVYPVTDMAGTSKSREANGHGYGLTIEAIDWCNKWSLEDISEANKPYASPLLAENFKSLPAACIITAEYDPLKDEGEAYAKCLSDAGVEVYTRRYDGVIHGFFRMQDLLEEARNALCLICERLTETFYKQNNK
jgi:Esterase/lipase